MSPITAIQVSGNQGLYHAFFSDKPQSEMSFAAKLFCSTGGGVLSGLLSGPVEMVVVHQNLTGNSFTKQLAVIRKTMGLRSVYRGFYHACARDGGFTAAFMTLGPWFTQKLQASGYMENEWAARISGGIGAGLVAAATTHPFDTWKTRLQHDYQAKKYKSVLDVFREEGAYVGLGARGLRVVSGCCIISLVTSVLTAKLAEYEAAQEGLVFDDDE
jgi:hypothetical protein